MWYHGIMKHWCLSYKPHITSHNCSSVCGRFCCFGCVPLTIGLWCLQAAASLGDAHALDSVVCLVLATAPLLDLSFISVRCCRHLCLRSHHLVFGLARILSHVLLAATASTLQPQLRSQLSWLHHRPLPVPILPCCRVLYHFVVPSSRLFVCCFAFPRLQIGFC